MIKGYNVAFDTNDCKNFLWTASVISMESMMTRAQLLYTLDHLTLGICSLIEPAAMAKNRYAISRQIPHSHVIMEISWQSPDTSSFEKY